MPKLFEYRGYWIDQEKGRNGYYRYWYDDRGRKVRRKKLLASNFETAKDELIAHVSTATKNSKSPERVFIADVLAHYIQHHATKKGYSTMANARRAAGLCIEAMMSVCEVPRVSDLTRINQRKVWSHMAEKHSLSAKSIYTYMISVRAAINYSAKPQIVLLDDEELEVKLLNETVMIFCNEAEIAENIDSAASKPRHWIPTYEELANWIDHLEKENDFRLVMLALNTWARNEAIFDLNVEKQVDYTHGTIDLNPPNRRQTKKKRPIVRLTTGLAAWLEYWGDNKPITAHRDRIEKRVNALGKKLDMPEMTIYTIRHFMATQCRRTSKPVSKEQRSEWLGHAVNTGSKTTDWYQTFDPDYLEEPMRATEEIIKKLDSLSQKSLFAPTVHPQSGFRIVG